MFKLILFSRCSFLVVTKDCMMSVLDSVGCCVNLLISCLCCHVEPRTSTLELSIQILNNLMNSSFVTNVA